MSSLHRTGQVIKAFFAFVVAACVLGLLAGLLVLPGIALPSAGAARSSSYILSLPVKLSRQPLPTRTTMLAADGSTIATLYHQNRTLVPLSKVSPQMRAALISVEDTRFYEHPGVDFKAVVRAFASDVSGGSQGGSTLTQQYVKNILLVNGQESANQRSIDRKIKEALLAIGVEHDVTKDQILEGYLNIAYYGGGAYGIEAAANHYFSIPASQLTVPQSALLAGLVQSPTGYEPTLHPKAATRRRNEVIDRMVATGRLSAAEGAAAKRTPLGLKVSNPAGGCSRSRYPFYCQYVVDQVLANPLYGKNLADRQKFLYSGGLTIHTSLEPATQDAAQRGLDATLGRDQPATAAMAVVVPGTGRVAALAMNRGWGTGPGKTQVVLPAKRAFQPGSTYKTFTLAAALEKGWDLNRTLYAASNYCPPKPMAAPPGCYGNESVHDVGTMNAQTALARSSNTFFVALEAWTGVLPTAQMGRRLGLPVPANVSAVDSSTTLGVHLASPLDIAGAYATFAARGVYCRPVAITSIIDAQGRDRDVAQANCHQEIDQKVADDVRTALVGVVSGPDPYRSGKLVNLTGRPVGGKTGTTDQRAAGWFTGVTPQYAASVWVGDPNASSVKLKSVRVNGVPVDMNEFGGYVAAEPAWSAAMRGALAGKPVVGFEQGGRSLMTAASGTVPDTTNMPVADAVGVLQGSGLTVSVAKRTKPSPNVAPNVVVGQSVPPGTIASGQAIQLSLSAGSNTSIRIAPPSQLGNGGIVTR